MKGSVYTHVCVYVREQPMPGELSQRMNESNEGEGMRKKMNKQTNKKAEIELNDDQRNGSKQRKLPIFPIFLPRLSCLLYAKRSFGSQT